MDWRSCRAYNRCHARIQNSPARRHYPLRQLFWLHGDRSAIGGSSRRRNAEGQLDLLVYALVYARAWGDCRRGDGLYGVIGVRPI